jgi:hypothetical protein
MSKTWLICATVWLLITCSLKLWIFIGLDHRQCVMEFDITWACSTVPLAVNIFIALSKKMLLEKLKIR